MAIEDVPVFQYQLRLCRLEYHGILPKRFKNRVTVPEIVTDDERAIDAQDIRMLLLKCSNRRLKDAGSRSVGDQDQGY